MDEVKKIKVIDSHTGGEPTRLVIEGFPDLGSGPMDERLHKLKTEHDHWRQAVILEPKGNDILVGALLCKPTKKEASAGVIFFNNEGYLGMCGHGTIGLVTSLYYLGMITKGEHLIETPVGDIMTTIHEDESVSLQNVYAYRYQHNVTVTVGEYGKITGDIAWGGNWFFLVNESPIPIHISNITKLSAFTIAVMKALQAENITGKGGAIIDHIELFQDHPTANSQNFVMCPGGAFDRSPCGTGTSAKMACLAADQTLKEGEIWTQASIIESEFTASYTIADDKGVIPTITGTAYVYGENTLILNHNDPFCWGFETR